MSHSTNNSAANEKHYTKYSRKMTYKITDLPGKKNYPEVSNEDEHSIIT